MKYVIKTGMCSILISALLLTLSCATPQASRLSPEEVIAESQVAMAQVRSYRYETSTVSTHDGKTEQWTEQGEISGPDRSHVISTWNGSASEQTMIGEDTYTRAAGAEVWNIRRPSPGAL